MNNRMQLLRLGLAARLLIAAACFSVARSMQAQTLTPTSGDTFVSDSMTGSDGTDLTAHTGEIGATWAQVTGITGVIKLTSNRCKGDSGRGSLYYDCGDPG